MGNSMAVLVSKVIRATPKSSRRYLTPIYQIVMRVKCVREFLIDKYSISECHEYWRNPPVGGNRPEAYLGNEEDTKSKFLLELIEKYVKKDGNVLEIGCNVGRNLNCLYSGGYKKLGGIEISANALDLLLKTYTELAKECTLYGASVEDTIVSISDNSYNAVYTMAVLEHIHPDSEWVFEHIARVAKDVIITIEDEISVSSHTFPRNYKEAFERVGMLQVEAINCKHVHRLSGSFMARVFKHNSIVD